MKRTDPKDHQKRALMRSALTKATTSSNLGGVEKRQGLPKPVTLPQVKLRDFDEEDKCSST